MNNAHIQTKPNFIAQLAIGLFLIINLIVCCATGFIIIYHKIYDLDAIGITVLLAIFFGSNYLFVFSIKTLAEISHYQLNLELENNFPPKLQEAVSSLKGELTEVVLARKEFNKIKDAIYYCTNEIGRFEKELMPTLMQKLVDFSMEANQRLIELEEEKSKLEKQITELLGTAERWEDLLVSDNPNIEIRPTRLICDAEKLITGLKIIYPMVGETFLPENHETITIPAGITFPKIKKCNSRGYIFNNRVLKKAHVEIE